MSSEPYALYIDQGATYRLSMEFKDPTGALVNVTGYSARMQLRKTISQDAADLSLVSPTHITVGTTNGKVDVVISASQTATLTGKKYVYDLEIESPAGVVTRLLNGVANVSPQVTR